MSAPLSKDWEKFPYSAKLWRLAGSLVRRWWPQRGTWAKLTFTSYGIIISAAIDIVWRHPWTLDLRWESDLNIDDDPPQWRAYVWPGFVNGRLPVVKYGHDLVPITDSEAKPVIMQWRNPQQSTGVTSGEGDNLVFLPGETFPLFFETLGVKGAAPGGVSPDLKADPFKTRQLRACDVILQTPRVAAVADANINPDGSVDLSSIFVNPAAHRGLHQVLATPKWIAPLNPSLGDWLQGNAQQPVVDEVRQATVWAVSPIGIADDAVPDASWEMFVQYTDTGFWNLAHNSPNPPKQIPDDPITIQTGLLFGTADQIFRALLNPENDYFEHVTAFFNASSYPGQYYSV